MIDLHSHILPKMDDGSASWEESYMLARLYERMGFEMVVATPHARVGEMSLENAWDVLAGVNKFKKRLRKRGINLRVLPGMEVELNPCLPAEIKKGTVLTLHCGNYLLVETPFFNLPHGWEKVVFDLADEGIKVIFAHPERCEQLAKTPKLADRMTAAGAYLQVNWDSFLGEFGREVKRVALDLAQRGLIHCLATDTHQAGVRDPGMVADAIEEVRQLIGAQNLELVSKVNPARALDRQDMENIDLDAIPSRRKSSKLTLNSFFPF